MQPTPEIESFISRVVALPPGPGVALDAVLQPSIDEEVELRKLFAQDRQNTRLANPYVGLLDVFAAPDAIRTTRARVVEGETDLYAQHVMPLDDKDRRKEGAPSMVSDLEEFKKNWAIFTEGSLSQLLDWNNVVAAGGSVLACMTPLDEKDKTSKRAIRKFYHSNAYPTSDVDLFLWGLNAEQAEAKIKSIYEAVRDSVPWDVTCIRTKHTVSIHSQYPYRSVQIVLRLYHSPAEILAGFDIDAPCCAYDAFDIQLIYNRRATRLGKPACGRGHDAPMQYRRHDASFSIGYEVYVPGLKRSEIDPTIFERAIARMEGLARLLVLRSWLMMECARHSSRAVATSVDALIKTAGSWNEFHFNPKNKAAVSIVIPPFSELSKNPYQHCPKPIDDDEKKLQEEEDELYIRERIKFIEENPGRQTMTGSFNPIDVGEWSEQVYIKPTQQLFTAIAARDRAAVQELLKQGIDVNQRDYVGRTTLHVAIAVKASDIAGDLIDAGARITARLADGRAPLHLAAIYDQPTIIAKLFERSTKNAADLKAKEEDEDNAKMDTTDVPGPISSEDDWSSHSDEDAVMSDLDEENEDDEGSEDEDGEKKPSKSKEDTVAPQDEIPVEEDDQPDIIVVDEFDWDFGFSALSYAIIYGSLPTVNALVEGGADPKLPSKKVQNDISESLHPLTLTILREDEDEACKIAERLSSFLLLLRLLLTPDANHLPSRGPCWSGKTCGDPLTLRPTCRHRSRLPSIQYQNVVFPIVTAIKKRNFAVFGVMLAYGAKLELAEPDVTKALDAAPTETRNRANIYGSAVKNYLDLSYQPLEIAVNAGDDIAKLLVALADISQKTGEARLAQQEEEEAVKIAEDTVMASAAKPEWKAFLQQYTTRWASNTTSADLAQSYKISEIRRKEQELERLEDVREFLPICKAPSLRRTPKPGRTFIRLSKLRRGCNLFHEIPYLAHNQRNPNQRRLTLIDDTIAKYDASGYTPLFAAISARRWSTAKVILAIATAQYQPDDKEDQMKFKVNVDSDDDESDEYDSDASEITIEKEEIRTATLRGGAMGTATPLQKSVIDHDLEAFVHIANLYQALPQPIELSDTHILNEILQQDHADILDEYIRRTGDGVDFEVVKKIGDVPAESELPAVTNDENKIYLGLNVHGKKRTDLAQKNDPNATGEEAPVVHPLVWRAVTVKAKDIITYLASDRPLAAYKFYASTHSNPKAIWLRRLQDDKSLGNVLEKKLSLLAKLQPSLITQALRTKIKFVGENALSLAVARGCDTKILDYLLARNVSATEHSSSRGWNVYHQICSGNNGDLLEYFLDKLPRNISEALLVEQSKGRLNTVIESLLLLIFCKCGSIRLVKILLAYSKSGLLMLDVDGQTPLHNAVSKSYARSRRSSSQQSLRKPCISRTAWATVLWTSPRFWNSATACKIAGNPLDIYLDNADKIVEMLGSLEQSQGKYKAKIISVITRWAAQREAKLPIYRENKRLRDEKDEEFKKLAHKPVGNLLDARDTAHSQQVWKLLHKAASESPAHVPRRLIHLFEVQQSVASTLSKVRSGDGDEAEDDDYNDAYRRRAYRRAKEDDRGQLDDEESEDKIERRQSMALKYLSIAPDTY
ncbi:ankyrin [Pholiota molesta]|nr:ankyrin [Pholiota molesta]